MIRIATSKYRFVGHIPTDHPLNGNPWQLHAPNQDHPWPTKYIKAQPKVLITPIKVHAGRVHPIALLPSSQ